MRAPKKIAAAFLLSMVAVFSGACMAEVDDANELASSEELGATTEGLTTDDASVDESVVEDGDTDSSTEQYWRRCRHYCEREYRQCLYGFGPYRPFHHGRRYRCDRMYHHCLRRCPGFGPHPHHGGPGPMP